MKVLTYILGEAVFIMCLVIRTIFVLVNWLIDGANRVDKTVCKGVAESCQSKKNRNTLMNELKAVWLGTPKRYVRVDKPLIPQVGKKWLDEKDHRHVRPDTTHEMSWRHMLCATGAIFFRLLAQAGPYKVQQTVRNENKKQSKKSKKNRRAA